MSMTKKETNYELLHFKPEFSSLMTKTVYKSYEKYKVFPSICHLISVTWGKGYHFSLCNCFLHV